MQSTFEERFDTFTLQCGWGSKNQESKMNEDEVMKVWINQQKTLLSWSNFIVISRPKHFPILWFIHTDYIPHSLTITWNGRSALFSSFICLFLREGKLKSSIQNSTIKLVYSIPNRESHILRRDFKTFRCNEFKHQHTENTHR